VIARYQALRQRIAQELEQLERTVSAIQRHWEKARLSGPDQDAYINSVALNLHSFYTGVERVLQLIAVEVDGGVLGGPSWHAELLRQMTVDVPAVRPPVLRTQTVQELDEYRKFRHLIRNIYTTNIDPDRIGQLVAKLPNVYAQLHQDLEAFLAFLDTLARADEE